MNKQIILDDYEREIEEHLEESNEIKNLHQEVALIQSAATNHALKS